MSRTLLFVAICGIALTCAFAQTPAAPASGGAAQAPAPAVNAQSAAPAAAPVAPAQGAPQAAQTQVPAQAEPAKSPASFLTGLLPIILIFVVFYFLLIMPQQRQRKKHTEMLSALKAGDRVVVLGGVHGIITRLKEGTMLVKIAENTEIEVDRSSVSYKAGGEQTK
jgi:preprotein translocase subunit YajC